MWLTYVAAAAALAFNVVIFVTLYLLPRPEQIGFDVVDRQRE